MPDSFQGPSPDNTPSGMRSTTGSQGELSDRGGTPGFQTAEAQVVSGQAQFGASPSREGQYGPER